MKILLDECVTKRLKPYLKDHATFTVTQMKWNGLRNGELLRRASDKNFDILLTIDKNISFQQSISKFEIALVILDTPSSNLMDIIPLAEQFLENISSLPGARRTWLH
ncbi:MAG: DUF5615 family PIN-like protein [Chitinophagales bacterium]